MQDSWSDLIKPKALELEEKTLTPTYGRFFCEPFERGFGTTLGTSLRRVLLSSLSGAAITKVKIRDVLHEFSTIPGIREDVTDILLNLKEVSYLDSAGLGELVGSYASVTHGGGSIKLLHPQAKVHDLLQVTKLYTVFVAFDDENEALRSFAGAAAGNRLFL